MPTLTRDAEYKRLAMLHRNWGDEYAERSHEFGGFDDLSDAYSAVAEAHQALAAVFSRRAGEERPEDQDYC